MTRDLDLAVLPTAARLANAVDRCDADEIARLLTPLDTQHLYALAVVLAAHVEVPLQDDRRPLTEIDDVVVERILNHDASLAGIATQAERRQVTERWVQLGRTLADLEALTGWRAQRYRTAECGTDGGYYHHRRVRKEDACGACKAAHSQAEKRRKEGSAA